MCSHTWSGILAAANLSEAVPVHWRMRLLCFGRGGVRHADPVASTPQYRHNMTGLKGWPKTKPFCLEQLPQHSSVRERAGWSSLFARAHGLGNRSASAINARGSTVELARWPPDSLWQDVDVVVDATGEVRDTLGHANAT